MNRTVPTTSTTTSPRRFGGRLAAVAAGITAVAVAVPAGAFELVLTLPEPEPVDRVAFVARNDNPFDALALGPVAGALGGIVVITGTDGLDEEAAAGLTAFDPDQVYLAGGEVALSPQVESDVEALGAWDVARVAGENRNETAQKLGQILDDLGVGRPVLTDATVAGSAYLEGEVIATVSRHTTVAPMTADDVAAPFDLPHAVTSATLPTTPADGQVLLDGTIWIRNDHGATADFLVRVGPDAVGFATIAPGEIASIALQGVTTTEADEDRTFTMSVTPGIGGLAQSLPFEYGGASLRAEYVPASGVTISE